ncbi:RlmE family RNA methyltransferase [Candidatus Bathyarchaeota archaeon]|nr:RlmE family RNA methyltransferase [Candidatus Bathyarchaeota archaeon]
MRRRRDQYHRLAVQKGYRSRAAFKLLEMIRSYRFIKRGDWVIELGAAPGGWTQVLAETVGAEGHVLAVDTRPMEPLDQAQVKSLQLDLTSESAVSTLAEVCGGKVDAVISDVSPNISGAWDLDHSRQIYLARRSLEVAESLLRTDGNFLVKVFQGRELSSFLNEVRRSFRGLRIIRPRATRVSSAELYVLGLGFLE